MTTIKVRDPGSRIKVIQLQKDIERNKEFARKAGIEVKEEKK